jgi:hypothetical protein
MSKTASQRATQLLTPIGQVGHTGPPNWSLSHSDTSTDISETIQAPLSPKTRT